MKTTIERRKPMRLWFPLMRVLRGETAEGNPFRVVEGYCYVNAVVGDGYDLTRAAMVAASDDYMRWGAVREMHQPAAVGTATGAVEIGGETLALGVTWDENGAFLRSKVVDADAIVKVDEEVYKGYSVSVRPKVMRGNKVETCEWIENSLVDRPFDPDAVFTLVRADGADVNAPAEVVRYWDEDDNWVSGPYTFNDQLAAIRENDVAEDLWDAFYALVSSCRAILAADDVTDKAAMCNQSLSEMVVYIQSDIFGDLGEEATDRVARSLDRFTTARKGSAVLTDALSRLAQTQTETAGVRAERDAAQRETAGLRAELAAAKETVERLEKLPDPTQDRPMKYAPAERLFLANRGQASSADAAVQTLQEELTALERSAPTLPTQEERVKAVHRMQVLKQQIAHAAQGSH